MTGNFINAFVSSGSGGLDGPRGVTFGPDNKLYVGSFNNDSVLKYDETTGTLISTFVPNGSGGLDGPVIVTFTSTPVPEPSSVLGTLAFSAFGTGYLLKRKLREL
jgi:DNA-binding beta-propeller fold protein YncE